MHAERLSLQQLHRDVIVRLASATGNLRMLTIGAPFVSELVQLARRRCAGTLDAAREAEDVRASISYKLSGHSQTEAGDC